MRPILILLFSLSAIRSIAQLNLVPNPDFEIFSACPTAGGQVGNASGWINANALGNADYYNACAPPLAYSVPYCGAYYSNFQFAYSGNGFIGLYNYSTQVPEVREYAQVNLNSPLVNGECYYIGFYANLSNWSAYGTNRLGCYLSTNAIYNPGPDYILNYNAQVTSFNNEIITDTLNWHLISGIFQAQGNEQYLTIGNFNHDASTDTIRITQLWDYHSYYYIEDVFVIPVNTIPGGMSAFAGNDVTIMPGDTTFIGQQISNLDCNWYVNGNLIASNTSGISVHPDSTTTYVVQQTLCGFTTTDTVVVTISPLGINQHTLAEEWGIQFSPNPSDGKVVLSKKTDADLGIKIVDETGKTVFADLFTGTKSELNLALENGIYFIQFFSEGKTMTRKIIIAR
ncbi:MAG TPA: T9SS type A sorting domain-containing protein [Bacteroidia bacterium]|nr:T9SS type A sorting domain-containing protein [Bacteroidia bacterium]